MNTMFDWLKRLFKRGKKEEGKEEEEGKVPIEEMDQRPTRVTRVVPPTEREEIYKEAVEELKRRIEQEKEARKKIEERFDELRTEYDKLREETKRKEDQLKEAEEKMSKMEEESSKLVKIIEKRYKKGRYIPVILWSERGSALPYRFVVEIGWVNGGYRALLVDSITADPSTGEWFPPLHMPAPNFCFMDDPGFNPDDPGHSVLFAVNRHDWEEDLKVTRADPEAKPPALVFGIDIKGNPVHPLRYGAPININTLRSENRALKRQVGLYYHKWKETEEKWRDAEFRYEIERQRREYLEEQVRWLKSQLYESRDALLLLGDEAEFMKDAIESEKRRRIVTTKRLLKTEELVDSELMKPGVSLLPGSKYFEQKTMEKEAEIVALLAPIARREAKAYEIDVKGKTDEEIVDEWIRKKYENENKTLADILRDYGLEDKFINIILGGMA